MHLGIDSKHLTEPADYYVGAVVRSEYGIVMGTPFPSRVEKYDAAQKGIGFQGIWFGASEKIIRATGITWKTSPIPEFARRIWSTTTPRKKSAVSISACPATATPIPPSSRRPSTST